MTQSKQKVLLVDVCKESLEEFQTFANKFDVIRYNLTTREQFIEDVKTKYNDISAIAALWQGFYAVGMLDREMIEALPSSCKVLSLASVGYNQHDMDALSERGIVLTNTPYATVEPVADLGLFLALATFRYTSAFENAFRQTLHSNRARKAVAELDHEAGTPKYHAEAPDHVWGQDAGEWHPECAAGSRVGIIGFGQIGKAIGKRLNMLGMDVHYTKRTPLTEAEEAKLGYSATFHPTREDVFKNSDLLMLSVPLTPETKGMVHAESLKLLPRGAKIVNVGRGGLIDQKALLDALKSKHISSAGLDVVQYEPDLEPELAERYDVTLLPHCGGATGKAYNESQVNVFANITSMLEKGVALHPVN